MAKLSNKEVRKLAEEFHGPQALGPLTWLVGEWEGNGGVDLSYHNKDDETGQTGYFERFRFHPIPKQENGQQEIEGLKYENTAWRHGEEAMNPFHDEVGYMLWDKKRGQVKRVVVFGRGIAILAGGDAKPRDKTLHFKATAGDRNYGILQNKYLSERAELKRFERHVQAQRRRNVQLRPDTGPEACSPGRQGAGPHRQEHVAPRQAFPSERRERLIAGDFEATVATRRGLPAAVPFFVRARFFALATARHRTDGRLKYSCAVSGTGIPDAELAYLVPVRTAAPGRLAVVARAADRARRRRAGRE